jgi:hypothetical protein
MQHAAFSLLLLAIFLLNNHGHALPLKIIQISKLTCNSTANKNIDTGSSPPISLIKSFALHNAAKTRDGNSSTMQDVIGHVVFVAEQKVKKSLRSLNRLQYPTATEAGGRWEIVKPGHWMAGFFPGVMWQLYDLNGKQVSNADGQPACQ